MYRFFPHMIILYAFAMLPCLGNAQILGADLHYEMLGKAQLQVVKTVYHGCAYNPKLDTLKVFDITKLVAGSQVNIMADSLYTDSSAYSSCKTICSEAVFTSTYFYRFNTNYWISQNIDSVRFTTTVGTRPKKLDYIDSAENSTWILEAECYQLTKLHGAVQFANKPIFTANVGLDYMSSPGLSFTDSVSAADSLHVSPVNPINAVGTISYNKSYGPSAPLKYTGFPNQTSLPSGYHLQPQTGDVRFRPSSSGSTLIKMACNFYHNGMAMGSITREIVLTVANDAAAKAYLISGQNQSSTYQPSNYAITQCSNDTAVLHIRSVSTVNDSLWLQIWSPNGWVDSSLYFDTAAVTLPWLAPGSNPPNLIVNLYRDSCFKMPLASATFSVEPAQSPSPSVSITYLGNANVFLNAKDSLVKNQYRWRFNGKNYNGDKVTASLRKPGMYHYRLTARTANNCTSVLNGQYTSPSFPYIEVSPGHAQICQNEDFPLNIQVFNANDQPELFIDNLPIGNVITIKTMIDTILPVKAVFTNGDTYWDTTSLKVVVPDEIQIAPTGGHCQGNALLLTIQDQAKLAYIDELQWFTQNGNQLAQGDSAIYSSGEGLVWVSSLDTQGCKLFDSVEIKYNLHPQLPPASIDPCVGDSFRMKATFIDGSTVTWKIADSLVGFGQSLPFTARDKAYLIDYELSYDSDSLNCSWSGSTAIEPVALPNISHVSSIAFCNNAAPISLDADSLAQPANGSWSLLDGGSADAIQDNTLFPAKTFSNELLVLYTVVDSNTGCVKDTAVSFQVKTAPEIDFSQRILPCIETNSLSLSAYASPVGGEWFGKGVFDSLAQNDTLYYFKPDSVPTGKGWVYYHVERNGCNSTDSQWVERGLHPQFGLSTISGKAPIIITFWDLTSCKVSNRTWFIPGITFPSGDSSFSYRFDIPGDYEVYLRVENNATGSSNFSDTAILQIRQGLSVASTETTIPAFYPNPADQQIVIENNLLNKPWDEAAIYTMTGHMCLRVHFNNQKALPVDVSAFPSGAYIIRFTGSNQSNMAKLIIQH